MSHENLQLAELAAFYCRSDRQICGIEWDQGSLYCMIQIRLAGPYGADQVAAEIFHRQSTLVCHRGQLQNVDRLSIRLVRERVEQRVQVVDRCHRIVVLRQRHDRDARDFDRMVQAQRVAVFEVDRPDDVALALFELLGVEARDNHRC